MKPATFVVLSLAVAGLAACADTPVTPGYSRLPPPTIDLHAASIDSGGVLRVLVSVWNPSSVHLQVMRSAQCPFAVRIFADSAGEQIVESGPPCPGASTTTDLAPGDTVWFSRTLSAAELAGNAPGLNAVNVTVGTKTGIVTTWGGMVRLPLASRP